MATVRDNRPQLIFVFILSSVLTHVLGQALPTSAANPGPTETASSSQPLWSYQVKPSNYVNAQTGQQNHYPTVPSLFDAFNGLSQRQGALTSSPFLSILPIILIAAGGMLLLLPLLTMMMASPFSGGFGGYNGGFGYPQVGSLNKKRSLADQIGGRNGLVDLIEHVSSTIDELTKKYANPPNGHQNKRAKSLNYPSTIETQSPSSSSPSSPQPANHKPASTGEENSNNLGVPAVGS